MHLSDELLSAYLDGELAPEEGRSAAAHLRGCGACAGSLGLFTALDTELTGPPALACSAASTFLSAKLDQELDAEESGVAAAHLASCAACRQDLQRWSAIDEAIAALPASRPSARVDAAIGALGRERRRLLPQLGAAWAPPAMALITAIALVLVLGLPPAGPTAALPAPDQSALYVASAQQSVLNPNTSTLYVLQPARGTVAALDAQTLAQKAVISLGGKPSALALNLATNTVLVLDASNKTVTEIDGSLSAVRSSTTVSMPGTPTRLQVGPNGDLVVTGVVAPGADGAPAALAGVVATFSGDTKQVESVREFEVAPSVIVIEANGKRALLVSAKATTLVDAATYQPLATVGGGVAAAFSTARDDFAVLSNGKAGATVTFARGGNALVIGGTPHAIAALPGGGFAILADSGGAGLISVINSDGARSATIEAPANAHDLSYDPLGRKFAVVAAGTVTSVPLPQTVTQVPPQVVSGTPLPTPQSTAAPAATSAPAPTEPVAVVAARESDSLVPAGARAVWPGTYLVTVGPTKRPTLAVGDGSRIWYLDEANRVWVLHVLAGGELLQIGALPPSASVTHAAVSPNHVYFLDLSARAIHVLTIDTKQISVVPLPIAATVTAIAASADERLWLATTSSGLVSYDPRTSRIESIAAGLELSVVATDSLGRVWTAARDRQAVDLYDPLTGKLSEFALVHSGAITALAVDHSDAVWVGMTTGQTVGLRSGVSGGTLIASGGVGRPITDLVVDASGALYYVSRSQSALLYGSARGSALVQTTSAETSEPMFDLLGRAWQADRASDGFFVTLPGGRP